MKSNCCESPIWINLGDVKINPKEEEKILSFPRGTFYFYTCEKCNQFCASQENANII
jgi:hypothetical protein